MSNVILALLSRTEAAPAILAGAERLALLLNGGQIEAMAMRIDAISSILVTRESMSKVEEERARAGEADHDIALRRVFDKWSAKFSGVRPRWIDEEGVTEGLIRTWGERADFIVVGRLDAYAGHAVRDAMHGALHASLFTSQRPVLMMPPQARPQFGKTLAIAWRDDEFSLRATLAALQLIPEPEQVHVFMGRRPEDPPPELPAVLASHNVRAKKHVISLDGEAFGKRLLEAVHNVKADLLVMGAFIHDPWHNLLFGGLTDYILARGDIPVLMRH